MMFCGKDCSCGTQHILKVKQYSGVQGVHLELCGLVLEQPDPEYQQDQGSSWVFISTADQTGQTTPLSYTERARVSCTG